MDEDNDIVLWPSGAGPEYVAARRALLERERELSRLAESVAAARRELPRGASADGYVFEEGSADLSREGGIVTTPLADLFGRHDTLVVYHLMFEPGSGQACPMCSMWVDGFRGVAAHLEQHTAFAVVAKAGAAELRRWGALRGWDGLRLLSSRHSTFNRDFGAETREGAQAPGVSVFVREDGAVRHFYSARPELSRTLTERGIDLLSPVWQVLDLLPGGRGQWYASNSYTEEG
ncbi:MULTISPECIES: DUF899 family protein [unclassified Nocardiopsis]|uniref:DUF899 family protein n=1 Tax=unclassified Nocardiopsis TaxID=2649073 RepID=UPI001914DF57|nr:MULTISPECIES: DUF899 family protein [unclassified Nocardiopsis]